LVIGKQKLLCLLGYGNNLPGDCLGNRPALGNLNGIAGMSLIVGIRYMILLGDSHDLAVYRMLYAALYENDRSVLHLVADNSTD